MHLCDTRGVGFIYYFYFESIGVYQSIKAYKIVCFPFIILLLILMSSIRSMNKIIEKVLYFISFLPQLLNSHSSVPELQAPSLTMLMENLLSICTYKYFSFIPVLVDHFWSFIAGTHIHRKAELLAFCSCRIYKYTNIKKVYIFHPIYFCFPVAATICSDIVIYTP